MYSKKGGDDSSSSINLVDTGIKIDLKIKLENENLHEKKEGSVLSSSSSLVIGKLKTLIFIFFTYLLI